MSGDVLKEDLHSGRSSSSPRAPGKSFSNFDISGGRNHIGDYYGSGSDSVLSRLPYADSAPFDSGHRQYERDCAEGTRLGVIGDIERWASGRDDRRIFWLNGLAGTGKSTIARTVARRLDDSGRLGATFFFSKGEGDAGSASKLVCTIAVQLAERCGELRGHIESVVQRNERIASAALLGQWKKLVMQPLTMLDDLDARLPIVLIIDALDECDTDRSIVAILHMLTLALPGRPLPLRVLLTSRPEGPIRNAFVAMSADLQETFVLHHIATSIVNQDVSRFLKAELAHIRLQRALPADWIDDEAIARLTESSGGLFIWAATACRYISDGRRYADRRFRQLLGSGQDCEGGPEAKLDNIYLMVLDNSITPTYTAQERHDAISTLRQVLGSLSVLYSSMSAVALSNLLGIPHHEVEQTLADLHAILDVPQGTTLPLRLHHPSLRDVLLDKGRCTSTNFCVDGAAAHRALANACLRIMSDSLRKDICRQDDPATSARDIPAQDREMYMPTELQYACLYWIRHVISSGGIDDLNALYVFLSEHLLHWLEAMSWIGTLRIGMVFLQVLAAFAPIESKPELHSFLDDACRFVANARTVISTYPLQTYLSGILFAPNEGIVKRTYQAHATPSWIASVPQMPEIWSPLLHTLENEDTTGSILSVAFSPDDQWLATGSTDGEVEIWNAVTGALLHSLVEHKRAVYEVRFSSNGTQLASLSLDWSLKVWETASGRCVWTLPIASRPRNASIRAMHYGGYRAHCFLLPNDRHLLVAMSWGVIQLWDLESGSFVYERVVHSDRVTCMASSPDGEWITLVFNDLDIWLWHTGTASSALLFESEVSIKALAFTSETHLEIQTGNTLLQIWDCTTMKLQESRNFESVHYRIVSPSGKLMAQKRSGLKTHPILIWEFATNKSRVIDSNAPAHSISPGDSVLATFEEGTVCLYDTATGILINTLHLQSLSSETYSHIVFSNSGQTLASGSRLASKIQLWTVEGPEQEVRNDTAGVSNTITVYTNGMRSPLSTDTWKQTKLTLKPTSDEWIVAFGKRIVWVPYQYRCHNKPKGSQFSYRTADIWPD